MLGYVNPRILPAPRFSVNYDQYQPNQMGSDIDTHDPPATYTGKRSIPEPTFQIAPGANDKQVSLDAWRGDIGNQIYQGPLQNANLEPPIPVTQNTISEKQWNAQGGWTATSASNT